MIIQSHIYSKKKKIFEKLLENFESEKIISVVQKKEFNIADDVVDNILKKLSNFEKKCEYTSQNLKLNQLAEEFETNVKYLSAIINKYKEKNFSDYLNDLRVEYAISKLNKDKRFIKFTIKAIAMECGFNTAESFSKAFRKKTGIYPSFFIKELENKL